MKQATSHLQGAITKVENAFPSIFTKNDVIILLGELSDAIENDDDVVNGGGIPLIDKDALIDVIRGAVENAIKNMDEDDIIDTSNVEFQFKNGNEIYLESGCIGLNNQDIIDDVMNEIENDIHDMYERIEEEKEN
jgi:hypothetical protein